MTQIPIVQAAPQPTSSGITVGKEEPRQFLPHLEKAVSENTQVITDPNTQNSSPTGNQVLTNSQSPENNKAFLKQIPVTDENSSLEIPSIAEQNSSFKTHSAIDTTQETVTGSLPANLFTALNSLNSAETSTASEKLPLVAEQNSSLKTHSAIDTIQETVANSHPADLNNLISTEPSTAFEKSSANENTLPISHEGGGNGAFLLQTSPFPTVSEKIATALSNISPTDSNEPSFKIDISETGPQGQNSPGISNAQNQTLLLQLQRIINNSNETGTVSIHGTVNGLSLQSASNTGATLAGAVSNQVSEQSKIGEKPAADTATLRQNMLAQYYDAKVNIKDQGDSGENTQTSDKQNNPNNQQLNSTLPSNTPFSPEQSSSFQHISTLVQNTGQDLNSKPVILPSGTIVTEDNIIQQVAESFRINSRINDTRLNIQLHPAELGELKIDLTFKDGSIKAHVIAHSQHAQEIIEKNMLKLKNNLEDQGFIIEEITVTSESDSVPDFDLFNQNLSQQSEFSPQISDPPPHDDFDIALEDGIRQSVQSTTTLNIKA